MLSLDSNNDGRVSIEEFDSMFRLERDERTKWFREIDTNDDGFLDEAEIRAWSVKLFKRIDLDGDGKITPAEWQSTVTIGLVRRLAPKWGPNRSH